MIFINPDLSGSVFHGAIFKLTLKTFCVASKIKLKKEEHVWETISGLDHSKGLNLPPSEIHLLIRIYFIFDKKNYFRQIKIFSEKSKKKIILVKMN